jgi:hypothetical protein
MINIKTDGAFASLRDIYLMGSGTWARPKDLPLFLLYKVYLVGVLP